MTPAPPIQELQGCRNRGQKGQLPPPLKISKPYNLNWGTDYVQHINTSPQISGPSYGPAGSTNNQLYYGNFLHSSFVILK